MGIWKSLVALMAAVCCAWSVSASVLTFDMTLSDPGFGQFTGYTNLSYDPTTGAPSADPLSQMEALNLLAADPSFQARLRDGAQNEIRPLFGLLPGQTAQGELHYSTTAPAVCAEAAYQAACATDAYVTKFTLNGRSISEAFGLSLASYGLGGTMLSITDTLLPSPYSQQVFRIFGDTGTLEYASDDYHTVTYQTPTTRIMFQSVTPIFTLSNVTGLPATESVFDVQPAPVPIPASLAFLVTALLGGGLFARTFSRQTRPQA